MIVCRVQGHPSRADLHERLLPLLDPLPTEVMLHSSDPPDPWAGYRRCLTGLPDVPHVLIVQDDAIPRPGFAEAVGRIAARWPDNPVCLFMGALPSETETRIRRSTPDVRYVVLGPGSFMPLVCVLWPTHVARSFLEWSLTARRITRADDGNAGRWRRMTKQTVMVSVPSLVQHDDDAASVKGGRLHKPWTERWRYAAQLADNGLDYDW